MSGEKLWKQFLHQGDPTEGAGEPKDKYRRLPTLGMSRRTFIEMIGFSAAAVAFSSCRAPEQKIVPYLKQPVELTPGVASWYASTCGGCSAACGTLVKVRDGRPIKLEGNPDHPLTGGGLCAVAHAMVFGLYDSARTRQPFVRSKPATWQQADEEILQKLAGVKESRGRVRLLTSPVTGPASREVIGSFLGQFADGKHVVYEPISNAGIRAAHLRSHNRAEIPSYKFDRAKLVVSFGADFLGTWISPVRFTRDYTASRNLDNAQQQMSRHVQFESRMSLTGSNADIRIKVSPAQEMQALILLASLLSSKARSPQEIPPGLRSHEPGGLEPRIRQAVERAAAEIIRLPGESLVVSGSNDIDAQYLVNFINEAAGNYAKTLDLQPERDKPDTDDSGMVDLVREMNAGQVAALIICGVNPAYDFYAAEEFVSGIGRVPLKISLSAAPDETSVLADYVCPQGHFLECWSDSEPVRGVYGLGQPAIAPLFQTRSYQDSLMAWSGDQRSFYEALRDYWRNLFPRQHAVASFDEFWDNSLRDGFSKTQSGPGEAVQFRAEGLAAAVQNLRDRSQTHPPNPSLVLYEKVAMRDGAHAGNPWLQELPDPITKITWDNYASISPVLAGKLGIDEGGVVRVTRGGSSIELPAHIQPGQHDDVIAIAVGYGRSIANKAGKGVGANAYPFVGFENGTFRYLSEGITIDKIGAKVVLAATQRHDTLDGRPIVKELTLDEYVQGPQNESQETTAEPASIWRDHPYGEHKWAMVVDLNACTGCSACTLSCQAENNVPVVGREEVRRQREMHWLRVDRYYQGSDKDPTVSYQPVMCSQCDNASCESVCPVLATVHSSEGLNMQVYNRCVGTRYCENNCPYKVRRFNWFSNEHVDPVANLSLNPDVTVRTRGVMEKCTFCVQRIEAAKIKARNEGRPVADGEIQTACQQSCPSRAISFGDLVDGSSRVNRLKRDRRDYILLEELNLRPSISYLARVRNSEEVGD